MFLWPSSRLFMSSSAGASPCNESCWQTHAARSEPCKSCHYLKLVCRDMAFLRGVFSFLTAFLEVSTLVPSAVRRTGQNYRGPPLVSLWLREVRSASPCQAVQGFGCVPPVQLRWAAGDDFLQLGKCVMSL